MLFHAPLVGLQQLACCMLLQLGTCRVGCAILGPPIEGVAVIHKRHTSCMPHDDLPVRCSRQPFAASLAQD